jgi:hypothetical protein
LFKIGVVTGCNAVFLLTERERLSLGIGREEVVPVVGRSLHVAGLSISPEELAELAERGEATWLLHPPTLGERGSGVRRRLAAIPARRRRSTLWFGKRSPWWNVNLGEAGDAIFTYMNDLGPRLVLATGPVYSTNTLHRAWFRPNVHGPQRRAAALSMISTFGQLAAERLGRRYGGGLLKFELSDARRLPVLPVQPDESLEWVFRLVDDSLRRGDRDMARSLADEALAAPLIGECWQCEVAAMRDEVRRLRSIRQGRPA